MAVEGKLVPQDPNDEPASVLLERIRKEKHRLIAEGKAKFPKGGESIIYTASDGSPYEKRVDAKGRVLSDESIADEVPFDLPEEWCWARLSTVADIQLGKMLDKQKNTGEQVPYLGNKNVRWGGFDLSNVNSMPMTKEEMKRYALQDGDLIACEGGVPGRCAIWENGSPMYYQKALHRIRCSDVLLNRYCEVWLSFIILSHIKDGEFTGTTIKHLPAQTLSSWIIPLPPLAEQRRIAERVAELMPLVEGYGELEDAREELDAALPGRLRRSVLQEAVRGRLAPQDPSDEPVGELLGRIRAERRELAAEGKLKLPKGGDSVIFTGSDGRRYEKRVDAKGRESEPVCIEDEIPFEIPEGWAWARLETISSPLRGSGIKRSEVADDGLPCVRYGELYTTYDSSIFDIASRTTGTVYETSKKLEPGEVLMTLTGENDVDIGKAVFNATSETLAFGGDLLALKGNFMSGEYLAMLINSPAVGKQRTAASTGNIIVHLSVAKVSQFLLPIPPSDEQVRILECVRNIFRMLTSQ
nr:restriction endonuclease subunit S [Collinsella intestinalis]